MVISITFNIQFRAADWIDDFSDDELVKLVFKTMNVSLRTAIAVTQLSEEQEAALVGPFDLFGSPHNYSRFHDDLKIFMECCLAHAKNGLAA